QHLPKKKLLDNQGLPKPTTCPQCQTGEKGSEEGQMRTSANGTPVHQRHTLFKHKLRACMSRTSAVLIDP
ncbi:Hypothetical predicted protein, partial [Marmota monax]